MGLDKRDGPLVEALVLLHVAHVPGSLDDLKDAGGVFFRQGACRRQKQVIAPAHQVERRRGDLVFGVIAKEPMHPPGEGKPAFEIALIALAGLADEELPGPLGATDPA